MSRAQLWLLARLWPCHKCINICHLGFGGTELFILDRKTWYIFLNHSYLHTGKCHSHSPPLTSDPPLFRTVQDTDQPQQLALTLFTDSRSNPLVHIGGLLLLFSTSSATPAFPAMLGSYCWASWPNGEDCWITECFPSWNLYLLELYEAKGPREVPPCQSCCRSEPPCLGPSSLLRVKGCNCLSEHPKPCEQREALISTHLWPGPAWRKEELGQGRREASVCARLRSSAFQHARAKQLKKRN